MARVHGRSEVSASGGRSVRLFLADGKATGILTAEIMNWTGHILACPRTRLEDALKRDELKRTGVYFLTGPDDDSDSTRLYVGEGDEIAKRLIQHNKEKVFWDRLIAVTSKDMNLTKAHVRYLESRLIALAVAARKSRLDNGTRPAFDRLPEGDISDMEAFLSEVQLVLPVIGADFLRKPNVSGAAPSNVVAPVPERQMSESGDHADVSFRVTNAKAGIDATAREIDGEFVVLAGSTGSMKERQSFHEKLKALRDDAIATGRVEKIGTDRFTLTEDMSCSSPSAAAVFLFGTSRNGRTDWLVTGKGIPYGDWKDRIIAAREGDL